MNAMTEFLTPEQEEAFRRDGFLILRGFYDPVADIEPIQRGIHSIIGLLLAEHGLNVEHPPFTPERFDVGYQELIAHDRRLGSVVYDAVKLIPAFVRLVADRRNEAVFCALRKTDAPGVAGGGYGIRIDNPGEERFRSDWHQEYPFQLRSLDGVVLWSPLLEITPELGPVHLCPGSHRDGALRVHMTNPNPERQGAYALHLENRDAVVARYPVVAPLTRPGDLMLVDFLTLHASGHNHSQRSRWSMQLRFFNFREPTGRRIRWRGSFAAGADFRDVHPELVVD